MRDTPPAAVAETHCVFHICSRGAATAALRKGQYSAPSLASEGFIHLSQAHQVAGVVEAFYAGQSDLVLLVIDPVLLVCPLRYEPPAHPVGANPAPETMSGQLFPHLYGPLNCNAIVDVVDVERFRG